MKHLDTFILSSHRNNLTFSSWHRVCIPFVGVVGQSKTHAKAMPKRKVKRFLHFATIFAIHRKNGFPTDGGWFVVDNTGPNSVMQWKTCRSSNLVFLQLTMRVFCVNRAGAHI